jgi:hypothetical protein
MVSTCICLQIKGRHYEQLAEYLNRFTKTSRPLPTLWFVKTDKDVKQIKEDIERLIDADDSVLVFTREHYAGYNIDLEQAGDIQAVWLK